MTKSTTGSLKRLKARAQQLKVEQESLIEELGVLKSYLAQSKSKQDRAEVEKLMKEIKRQ